MCSREVEVINRSLSFWWVRDVSRGLVLCLRRVVVCQYHQYSLILVCLGVSHRLVYTVFKFYLSLSSFTLVETSYDALSTSLVLGVTSRFIGFTSSRCGIIVFRSDIFLSWLIGAEQCTKNTMQPGWSMRFVPSQ